MVLKDVLVSSTYITIIFSIFFGTIPPYSNSIVYLSLFGHRRTSQNLATARNCKMGKTQKKRAMRRHNPMRVPDSHLQHGLTSASASTSTAKKDAVLPVIEKVRFCPVDLL